MAGAAARSTRVLVVEAGAGFGGSVVCLAKLVRVMRASGYDMRAAVLHSVDAARMFLSGEHVPAMHLRGYKRSTRMNEVLARVASRSTGAKLLLLAGLLPAEWVLRGPTRAALARMIKQNRPDILAFNNAFDAELDAVAGHHGLAGRTLVHGRGLWDRPTLPRTRRFPLLVAMSQAVARSYEDAGWPRHQSMVVYDPFPIPTPPPPPLDLHLLTEGRRMVAIVGSLQAWKGHSVFVEAAAMLRARHNDVRFLIVGGETLAEPNYPAELAQKIRHLGVGSSVKVTGWRNDVDAIVASADVVVHASTSPEPFGNVVPEALALGRAVVAARAGGPMEVIRHEIDGLLSTPGAADELAANISRLLEDDNLRSALGEKGRERVREQFSEAQFASGMRTAYERVLAEPGQRASR